MGSIGSPEEAKQDSNTVPENAGQGQRRAPGVKRDDSVPSESRLVPDDADMAEATGGMKIVVTPADGAAAGGDDMVPSDIDSPVASDAEAEEPKKKKVDSTLGGKISWKKVADFSALLPRDVKLKLWNGVFKTEQDKEAPEVKRISKVLRTFVMLQLTREYKKQNAPVPDDLKKQLPGAVKEPSKFISVFLKKEDKNKTMEEIFNTIKDRFVTEDESRKQKYAKKLKVTMENYKDLTGDDGAEQLKEVFNEKDFLKTAFLQYMLYAYQRDMEAS